MKESTTKKLLRYYLGSALAVIGLFILALSIGMADSNISYAFAGILFGAFVVMVSNIPFIVNMSEALTRVRLMKKNGR